MEDFCGKGFAAHGLIIGIVVGGGCVAPEVPGVSVRVVARCIIYARVCGVACELLVNGAVVGVLVGEVVIDLESVIIVSVGLSDMGPLQKQDGHQHTSDHLTNCPGTSSSATNHRLPC